MTSVAIAEAGMVVGITRQSAIDDNAFCGIGQAASRQTPGLTFVTPLTLSDRECDIFMKFYIEVAFSKHFSAAAVLR